MKIGVSLSYKVQPARFEPFEVGVYVEHDFGDDGGTLATDLVSGRAKILQDQASAAMASALQEEVRKFTGKTITLPRQEA